MLLQISPSSLLPPVSPVSLSSLSSPLLSSPLSLSFFLSSRLGYPHEEAREHADMNSTESYQNRVNRHRQ